MADHDGRPKDGHRHPVDTEQPLDLPPRAQVRGQALIIVAAQAAEVDDPFESRSRPPRH